MKTVLTAEFTFGYVPRHTDGTMQRAIELHGEYDPEEGCVRITHATKPNSDDDGDPFTLDDVAAIFKGLDCYVYTEDEVPAPEVAPAIPPRVAPKAEKPEQLSIPGASASNGKPLKKPKPAPVAQEPDEGDSAEPEAAEDFPAGLKAATTIRAVVGYIVNEMGSDATLEAVTASALKLQAAGLGPLQGHADLVARVTKHAGAFGVEA